MEDENSHIEHITPEENSLSSLQKDFLCNKDGCSRTFKSLPVLRLHQSQVHYHQRIKKNRDKKFDVKERFHCPVKDCIYYFSSFAASRYFEKLRYLKQHYLKVHNPASFPCDSCNKSFTTKAYLRDHEKYCKLDLSCACGRKFSSISSLQTHVRRTSHTSGILQTILSDRHKEKQTKKATSSPGALLGNPGTSNATSSPVPILPKPQPGHLMAAIALSELASAGLNRLPSSVDVGVQTDVVTYRKVSKKFSSPRRHREIQTSKRKHTTEIQTQTHLTTSKNKIRRKSQTQKLLKINKTAATNTLSTIHSHSTSSKNGCINGNVNIKSTLPCNIHKQNMASSTEVFNEFLSRDASCSTQTYLDIPDQITSKPEYDHLPMVLACSNINETRMLTANDKIISINDKCVGEPSTISKFDLDSYNLSQLINNVDAVDTSHSNIYSSTISYKYDYSDIQTQTDHDIFLTNINDTDDQTNFATCAETQTDCSSFVDTSLWCTSETQTYEDFSDIEPFLCSTIHSQSVVSESSELFPDLENFTSDIQTQTDLGEQSNSFKLTSHTQT